MLMTSACQHQAVDAATVGEPAGPGGGREALVALADLGIFTPERDGHQVLWSMARPSGRGGILCCAKRQERAVCQGGE